MSKRKSEAERREDQRAVKAKVWGALQPMLDRATSVDDAKALLREMPRPDTPGRILFTSLQFFLGEWRPPGDAIKSELRCYLRFVERLTKAGTLPKAAEGAAESLRAAIDDPNRL